MKNLLFFIITILLAAFLFSGCTAIKNAKDSKAMGRVYANPDLSNQVFARLVIEHPCPPSTIEYIPGKTVTVIDSVKGNNDSLNNIIDSLLSKNCPIENLDSLKKAIQKNCKPVIITVTNNTRDTLKIPDPRQLQMATDSLNFQRGQNVSLTNDVNIYRKSNSNKTWWIVGISAFSLIIIGGLIYLLFQKKLL